VDPLERKIMRFSHKGKRVSDGEIWTAHGGVNPCGLVVQRGDRELRTQWLC
jgi:hypothetical protein